jgi:ribosomal protein S18 acetylase RimI-like enzyme
VALHRMRRLLAEPVVHLPLPDGVTIVPFDAAMAPAVRELMNRAYAAGFGNVMTVEEWWSALSTDSEYDAALCFLAMAEGRPVGFCQCWTSSFIKDLVAAPEWQGRGLGAALLSRALAALAERDHRSVDLKVVVENDKAQSLYRRLGFEAVERLE